MNSSSNTPSATEAVLNAGAPDLVRHPPRSPRVRLGGYAILARSLDKGRASIAGRIGEYHFGCPLDRQFLDFVGLKTEALREQLSLGKSDAEILAWAGQHATPQRSPEEIAAWSAGQETRAPADADSTAYFAEVKAKVAAHRSDIASWFDLLDVDDYVSFGGNS